MSKTNKKNKTITIPEGVFEVLQALSFIIPLGIFFAFILAIALSDKGTIWMKIVSIVLLIACPFYYRHLHREYSEPMKK